MLGKLAVLTAACTYASTAAAAGTDLSFSSNWAGYAVTGTNATTGAQTTFTVASGTWTQPAATCTTGTATWSSFWIGLGGFSETSQALEQIGTEADCTANGTASYTAWWEIVPSAAVPVKLKVSAGDQLSAVVVAHGSQVILRLRNLTRHTVFTKKATDAAPDLTSAEWVAEAPASCSTSSCSVLPLTNFGTLAFTSAAAIGDGHTGTIADGAWTQNPIELVVDDRSPTATGAIPSELAPDGGSFTVTYSNSVEQPALR